MPQSKDDKDGDKYEWVDVAFSARDTFSSKASEISRNLGFVGLGLILLLGGVAKDTLGGGQVVDLPTSLIVAGCLLVASLLCDLLQYAYASAAYGIWARTEEKRIDEKPKAPKTGLPSKINVPTSVCFWSKLALAAAAYAILLHYLAYSVS